MKKYSKAIAAILAVIMCLSFCAFSAYADENDGQQNEVVDDGQGGGQSGGQGGGADNAEAGGGEQGIADQDSGYNSGDESSYVPYIPETPESSNENVDNGNGGGYDNGYDYNTDNNSDDSNNNNVYYDSDGNSYSNSDEVYVGGGQSYQPPVSTAPPAALYEADKKIDVNELSKNDWGDIANLLKNTGSKDSDGDDFAFIQNNTSKVDNGYWIIIVGATCIALSLAGFTYLIVSAIVRRKKIKAGNITKTSAPRNSGGSYRASDDYNDGYGGSKPAKQQPKQSKSNSSGHYSSGSNSGKSKGGNKGGKRYR